MGVYELSGAGSIKTGRTLYTSMNAGNQYGAMVPIASQTSTGSSATFTFNSIPSIYQDLMLVVFSRSGTTGPYTDYYVRLAANNGAIDSGNNYSTTRLLGSGISATSDRFTSTSLIYCGQTPASTATAGIYSSSLIHILNYANSTTAKTLLTRTATDQNGDGYVSMNVGLWTNTGAITSLQVITNASFISGSTFTLYGIRAVSS